MSFKTKSSDEVVDYEKLKVKGLLDLLERTGPWTYISAVYERNLTEETKEYIKQLIREDLERN